MKKRNNRIRAACIAIITAMSLIGCTNTGSVTPTEETISSTEIASSEQSVDDTNIGGNRFEVGSNVAETSEIESTETHSPGTKMWTPDWAVTISGDKLDIHEVFG